MVIIVLVFCLQLTARLLIPKLRLIWSGEKIVVARLLQEHRQKAKDEEAKKDEREKFGNSLVTGMDLSQPNTHYSTNGNTTGCSAVNSSVDDNSARQRNHQRRDPRIPSEMMSIDETTDENGNDENYVSMEKLEESETVSTSDLQDRRSAPRHRKRLVVSEEHAPPTKLAMSVLSVSNELTFVNEVRLPTCAVFLHGPQSYVIYPLTSMDAGAVHCFYFMIAGHDWSASKYRRLEAYGSGYRRIPCSPGRC